MQASLVVQSIMKDIHVRVQGKSVSVIRVALGELSEMDQTLLEQRWADLALGTPLEHVQLHIRLIPAEVQCMACFSKYQPVDKKILCPTCGSFGAKILTGEECHLEAIETEYD